MPTPNPVPAPEPPPRAEAPAPIQLAPSPRALDSAPRPHTSGRLETPEGAAAQIVAEGDGHRVEVLASDGAVVFSYDAKSGRGTLSVPLGDLTLSAPRGNIDLIAGRALRTYAAEAITMESAGAVRLRGRGAGEGPGTSLDVEPQQLRLASERVQLDAARGDFHVGQGHYAGERLSATIAHLHSVVGKMEMVAGRVLSRAQNVYQDVEELHQLRAGRLRALVSEAMDFKGKSVTLRAEKDVRIDGEQIHLG